MTQLRTTLFASHKAIVWEIFHSYLARQQSIEMDGSARAILIPRPSKSSQTLSGVLRAGVSSLANVIKVAGS